MTIKIRITLLLAMALLALVVLSGVGLFQLSAAQSRFEYISSNTFPSLKSLETAQKSLARVRIALRNHAAHVNAEKKQLDEKEVEAALTDFDQAIAYYEKNLADEDTDRKLVKQDKDDMARYRAAMGEFFNNSRSNYMSVANAQLDGGDLFQLAGKLEDDLVKHVEYNYQSAGELVRANQAAYNQARWIQAGLAAAVLLAVAIGGFMLIRSIVGSLSEMQHTMEKISRERDFSARVRSKGQDEIGRTATAFNSLVEGVQTSLRELRSGSQEVVASSNAMADNAQAIYRAAAQQSESSSAVAATIEQMTVSVNHVAERADEAHDLSRSSSEKAEAGSATISQTIRDIREISQAIGSASTAINGLNQQSSQIVSVVQVIRDVADQTNLLALNAAIEAARAGEMGRGFAVVADEVRKLAERTTNTTDSIGGIVAEIGRITQTAVGSMDATVTEVGEVNGQIGLSSANLQGLIEAAQSSSRQAEELAQEMSSKSDSINVMAAALEQLNALSEQNQETTHSVGESARHLADTALDLEHLTEDFRKWSTRN